MLKLAAAAAAAANRYGEHVVMTWDKRIDFILDSMLQLAH